MLKSQFEGILIHKTPYQERHLIGQLLLRSGKKVSVLFFGGMGGGKKMKVSGLEVGHLLRFDIGLNTKTTEVYSCREWQVKWEHSQIRHNHQSFQLMCFYLEITRQLASEDQLRDIHREADQSSAGLFRVLSNALVHLDNRLEQNDFSLGAEMILFLGKLLIEQGVFPERAHCCLSGEVLGPKDKVALLAEQGGFAKVDLMEASHERQHIGEAGSELWSLLGEIAYRKYDEIGTLKLRSMGCVTALQSYFCYQLQIQPNKLKTLSLLV